MENAAIVYVKYLVKTCFPDNLSIIYPLPSSFPLWQTLGALALLAVISLLTWSARKSQPALMVGWFWYLVTLVPVIGLIQVGGKPWPTATPTSPRSGSSSWRPPASPT